MSRDITSNGAGISTNQQRVKLLLLAVTDNSCYNLERVKLLQAITVNINNNQPIVKL